MSAFGSEKVTGEDTEVQIHRERHVLLHRMLDELMADYISKTGRRLGNSTLLDLMDWSHSQTISPTTEDAVLHPVGREKDW